MVRVASDLVWVQHHLLVPLPLIPAPYLSPLLYSLDLPLSLHFFPAPGPGGGMSPRIFLRIWDGLATLDTLSLTTAVAPRPHIPVPYLGVWL